MKRKLRWQVTFNRRKLKTAIRVKAQTSHIWRWMDINTVSDCMYLRSFRAPQNKAHFVWAFQNAEGRLGLTSLIRGQLLAIEQCSIQFWSRWEQTRTPYRAWCCCLLLSFGVMKGLDNEYYRKSEGFCCPRLWLILWSYHFPFGKRIRKQTLITVYKAPNFFFERWRNLLLSHG